MVLWQNVVLSVKSIMLIDNLEFTKRFYKKVKQVLLEQGVKYVQS